MVATEAAVKAHIPAPQDTVPADHDTGDPRKRQSGRDRRQAKKRRFQSDLEELIEKAPSVGATESASWGAAGGKDSGGKGKSKSKDQAGILICFSWASGTGVCRNLPPGAECQVAVKRAHKFRKCLSPAHKDADCLK